MGVGVEELSGQEEVVLERPGGSKKIYMIIVSHAWFC